MAEGPDVVDEVVNVGGEEGEEADVRWLVYGSIVCGFGLLVLEFILPT